MNEQGKLGWLLPVVMVGAAAALFVGFVYGYPRLFTAIEASHPDHFEKNVADILARGDIPRAMKIARRATQVRPLDPLAYTAYGRTLLAAGNPEEAFAQLNKAVNLQEETFRDTTHKTRNPFYCAPARLALGKIYMDQGKPIDAIAEFEFARALADLDDGKFDEYHPEMFQVYGKQALWNRALEFGEPSDQELDALDTAQLARIARVCEGKQDWRLAGRLAARFASRRDFVPQAQYLQGRADLAQKRVEASLANLKPAAEAGYPHAAYFLGAALESGNQPELAMQAYLRAQPGDPYRSFALAKAWTLLTTLPENSAVRASVTQQDVLGQLDTEIAEMRRLAQPTAYDKYRRFTLVAAKAQDDYFASGGRFPLLTLWGIEKSTITDPPSVSFSSPADGETLSFRRGADTILQLQWVGNLVNWEAVEQLPPGIGPIPGWVDSARDWFYLRGDHAAGIEREGAQGRLSITKPTWFYSVPAHVQYDGGYLLAGRYKGPKKKVVFGWQSLDVNGHVNFENNILGQDESEAWTSQAGYMRSQFQWDTIRVKLDVLPGAGTVSFADMMLVKLNEPDPAFLK